MNVIPMMNEIHLVANTRIGEPALPYFSLSPDDTSEFVRVRAFDELNRSFYGDVRSRSEQEMHMFRHQDEPMQSISPLASMPIKSFQKDPDIRFNHEEPSTLPRAEGHEISSRRRDSSSRLQSKPQRLKAAIAFQSKLARVKLVPFPVDFFAGDFFSGRDA
jgi:hypothetical protein